MVRAFRQYTDNDSEMMVERVRERESEREGWRTFFTMNSGHFIDYKVLYLHAKKRYVSVYFGELNLSSFHARGFAQRNSKRQVKIAFKHSLWFEKQSKLKNYTQSNADIERHGMHVFRFIVIIRITIATKTPSI